MTSVDQPPRAEPAPGVIAPEGELDHLASRRLAPLLDRSAANADGGPLIIDLSAVSFLDSSSLGAIVATLERLTRQGRFVGLVVPNGSAAAVMLDLSGMRHRFATYPTREAAQRAADDR